VKVARVHTTPRVAAGNAGAFLGDVLGALFVEGFDLADPGAVRLDGIDDYINLAQNQSLPICATRLTRSPCG